MTVKLVGADDTTVDGGLQYAYAFFARFTSVAAGTISEFKVKSHTQVDGHVKVAIYADDGTGDHPTTRLSYNDDSQTVQPGWNILSIPELAVTNGTYYWLAIVTDSDTAGGYDLTAGVYKRRAVGGGGFAAWTWANPAVYDDSQTNTIVLVAGWGDLALTQKSLAGTLNLSGSVVGKYRQFKSLAGTLNLSGALTGVMKWWVSLSGTLNLSGAVSKIYRQVKSIAGTLNITGSLIARRAAVILTGTLNLSGSLSSIKGIFKSLAGTLNFSGSVSSVLKIFKSLAGSLSFIGIVSVLRKIIGAGAVSVDSYLEINTFHLSKFTAEFTGIVSKIKVYSEGSCNIKVAVYSDVGGEPSSLLSVVNTSTAVVAGWNTITIPSVSVSLGSSYWLAFNSG